MVNFWRPPPAPPEFGKDKIITEKTASLFSKLVFEWLTPFLSVGFSRPLEKDDLWSLPDARLTHHITDKIERDFYRRCPPEQRPPFLRKRWDDTDPDPEVEETEVDKEIEGSATEASHDKEKTSSEADPEKGGEPATTPNLKRTFTRRSVKRDKKTGKAVYDSSLWKGIHRTFLYRWWIAGALKLIGDTLKTTTPLLTKVILQWLTDSYYWYTLNAEEQAVASAAGLIKKPKGIGYGIGLAFALFIMQEVSSLTTNHYQQTTMTTGLSVRTGIIGAIFRKSLRLSGRARLEHSVGQITTMISTDATRLDRFSAFVHNLWVSPIQIAIGIALVINNLGYSALVGLGVLILGFPVQFLLVRVMFAQRKKGVSITDKRLRLTNEVLQGVRLIKFYAWEQFYTQQVNKLRTSEIATVKKVAIARSGLIAVVTFIPVLASVLSFITYALSGHQLNVAIIFSSLQLFNVIRMPLIFLPFVLSALSDAMVALTRISKFLTAEELEEPYLIDYKREAAVDVDGDFTWETAGKVIFEPKFSGGARRGRGGRGGGGAGRGPSDREALKKKEAEKKKKEEEKKKAKEAKGKKGKEVLPTTAEEGKKEGEEEGKKDDEKPFELKNLKLTVPKGAFVAIVGRVGSGKSSVLQGLIGEMRSTRGNVVFNGNVSYVPQTAWIRNATLRENITFGQEDNEDKFQAVVRACSLTHDLAVLPNGENTEIGEKGINLSGGQKARVSLARAAYSNTDIVLLDDPLSAVDAYVGKAILDECILSGPLATRTRVLVTHALHVLDKTDYIYVMDEGEFKEQGTYEVRIDENSSIFVRLMDEYGSLEQEAAGPGKAKKSESATEVADPSKKGPGLMSAEERFTGAVTFETYAKYLKFAGGLVWAPIILLILTLAQGSSVGNNLFLGFWTEESIKGFSQGEYMGVYAALGFGTAFFAFFLSFAFAYASLRASLTMFKAALEAVLRAPVAFFDTTPMGRIVSRFSKDQDTLDTELAMTLWQFSFSLSSVIGLVGLTFYTFPYLGIIFVPLTILYYGVASFYRRTSVETKRLDSLMRSNLYSSYTETLTGLSTIRAYNEQARSIRDAEAGLDLENRAYMMTIAIQRWLGVRLDFFGNILILGIALFAAGFRQSVNPAKIGVVLSYSLSITQTFSDMVTQFAQNEQNMNAVERVLVYTEIPSEGALTTPNDPPASWPDKGEVKFKNVELAYREGLPLVLKNISFDVRAGEKIGIVGRTGAGKSSLLQAFSAVELQGGEIEIDGRDISKLGLNSLRGGVGLVPQDATLFLGTLRENIDPQGTRTDAELITALQRSWLLPKDGVKDAAAEAKFSLDSTVGDEGGNFSAGEKQLLALCRALVKNSRIIVLDEATSSVDVETDAKIQRTIQAEFSTSTLLCIAHRLNTIVYYDRILVMDQGKVAEYDTVLNLYDNETSIFRSLCDEANLSRADILRIRAESGAATTSA